MDLTNAFRAPKTIWKFEKQAAGSEIPLGIHLGKCQEMIMFDELANS